MLAGGYSWRLFFYVVFAFAMALLIAAFFIVEETAYKRPKVPLTPPATVVESEKVHDASHTEVAANIPPRKTFAQTLKPWSGIDHEQEFWIMIPRSFTYFLVPQVLWVATSFGIYIGLGALAFNYTFPLKITAPPYNWSQTNSGLITIATFLGTTPNVGWLFNTYH
jgi:hypothetical protein